MADPWTWEPMGTSRWRQRQQFEVEARKQAARFLMENQARGTGVDPSTLQTPTSAFDKPPESSFLQDVGGGIFGAVKKFTGLALDLPRLPEKALKATVGKVPVVGGTASDILSTISPTAALQNPVSRFRTAFRPIDNAMGGRLSDVAEAAGFGGTSNVPEAGLNIAKPVFKALDFEQQHIGSPVYRGITTGIAAPFRMAIRGESFDEAVKSGWQKSGELGILGDIGAMAFSPSTWLGFPGAGEAIKGLAGARLFGGMARFRGELSVAQDISKALDIPELMGAAKAAKLGPIGNTANDTLMGRLEQSLRDPSKANIGPNVIRTIANWFNPSINLDRTVHVAENMKLAAQATVSDAMRADYKPTLTKLISLWDLERPTYIGPADNPLRALPKGKLLDFLSNPDFYSNVSPRLRAQIQKLDNVGAKWVEQLRYQRGLDIAYFAPDKAGATYVPTMASKADGTLVAAEIARDIPKVASLGTHPSVTKPRWYQNAYERMVDAAKKGESFTPETDLNTLFDVHNRSLSGAAGSSAFRTSVGGLSATDVKDLEYPGLRAAKDAVAAQLSNAKGRATTLLTKIKGLGYSKQVYESEINRLYKRANPIVDQLVALGDQYGPEFSHLAGQYHELSISLNAMSKAADKTLARSTTARTTLDALKTEMDTLATHLSDLRAGYAAAPIDSAKYAWSAATNSYHTPKIASDIGTVLQQGTAGGHLGDIMDEVRLFVFAADFSPLAIQGVLGAAAHPVNAARSAGKIVEALKGQDWALKEAVDNPEWVGLWNESMGRTLGSRAVRASGEVAKTKSGLERLPLVGGGLQHFNDRLMNAVEAVHYTGWKNDTELASKLTGDPIHVAAKDSAVVWSRIIPELLQGERGVSVHRARLERLPVISTSFIAAPALVMKDITSAMMHLAWSKSLNPAERLSALSGREQLALRRYGNMAGTLMTVSAISALMSADTKGQTSMEALQSVFDPTSPQFLSLVLGKEVSIGLGGPFRSFLKATIGGKDANGDWVPFAGIVPLLSLATGKGAEGIIPSFWRGKLAPPVGLATDLLQNKDFAGRTIVGNDSVPAKILETLWYAGETLTPTTAGGLMEAARTGQGIGPTQLVKGAVAQVAGFNYRETSPYDSLRMTRDDLARQNYNVNWSDLEPFQRAKLQQDHPQELAHPEATSDVGKALADQQIVLQKYQDAQQQLDDIIPPGPAWAEQHRLLNVAKSAALDEWARANPDAVDELTKQPSSPGQQALGQYYEAFKSSKDPWGQLDSELLTQRLNQLDSQWTPQQKAYIDRNVGIHDTATTKQWKAAQKVLAPYWNIGDDVWSKLQRGFPDKYAQYGSVDEFVVAQTQLLMARGIGQDVAMQRVSQMPVVTGYQDAVTRLRLRYRLAHKDVQKELALWYGYEPATPSTSKTSLITKPHAPSFLTTIAKPLGVR